jgi:hypothetical protein
MNWKGVMPAITIPVGAEYRADHGFYSETK